LLKEEIMKWSNGEKLEVTCGNCAGCGFTLNEKKISVKCPACNGTGKIRLDGTSN